MNTPLNSKLFSKKKLVYYGIVIFYIFTLYPLVTAFTHFINSKTLTLYYPFSQTNISSSAPPYFCKAPFSTQKKETLSHNIETAIRHNLLPNFSLSLSFKENLISLQSLQLNDSTLVIDFSKEFYTLSSEEELSFTYSVLLNLYHNFPKLSEVFITVNGLSHQFLNSSLSYKTPFLLKELPQKIEKQFSSLSLSYSLLSTFPPCPGY